MGSPRIVVLTYDAPHRKTEDVIWRLFSAGHWGQMSVVATPWEIRKERKYIFGHRPAEKHWACAPISEPHTLCAKLGLDYRVVTKESLHDHLKGISPDVVVIGGAGILEKRVVLEFNVLNVHPGLLPARRGLDVFKWAIIDCVPVGVTAHLCDENTDLGWRVLDETVPVYSEDSLQSFAMRQYEAELNLIPLSVQLVLDNLHSDNRFDKIRADETVAHKRMPLKIEATLLRAFEVYKAVYA